MEAEEEGYYECEHARKNIRHRNIQGVRDGHRLHAESHNENAVRCEHYHVRAHGGVEESV